MLSQHARRAFTNYARQSIQTFPSLRNLSTAPTSTPTQTTPTQALTPSAALSLLQTQQHSLYVLAKLHNQTYLLHPHSLLTLARLPASVPVSSKIRLTEIKELGSREYTIRSTSQKSVVDETGLRVEGIVVEHTKGSMEFIHKKKRRKGYERTIQHKQGYTRIRIGDFSFDPLPLSQSQSQSPSRKEEKVLITSE